MAMDRQSAYEMDQERSTSLDLLGPRTKTLAETEYRNVLSSPLRLKLYNAVTSNDVTIVKQFFNSGIDMKLGSVQNRGFTKLLLGAAIENDNDKILEILISHNAKIGGILFTAVRQGSYKCVKYLVKIFEKLADEHDDLGPSDCKPEGFITPLMMAIQTNDHTLVEYLITQGYQVRNDDYIYDDGMKNDLGIPLPVITRHMRVKMRRKADKINLPKEHSIVLKIKTYKSLANPLYISYMYIHDKTTVNPLYQIFTLSRELALKASNDEEFKEDYHELSRHLEDFAVDLMEQCRTIREIKILTDIAHQWSEKRQKHVEIKKETAKDLEFINLAIKGNNDKLVAHPYSQLCLNMVLYKNVYTIFNSEPNWRDRSSFSVFLYTFRHILLLPFMALIHIIAPCTKITQALGNPMIKFMSHFWSMLMFVVLLVVSAFQDKFQKEDIFKPSIPDWLILAWVVGLIVQEIKELSIQGSRRYFSQWWNTVTFLMVLLFTISYILRLIAYGITGNWVVLDPIKDLTPSATFKTILLANSLFSVGMVLSFLRISAAFQANDKLGPLQLSLYHLILDVMKFLVFFALIIISFGFSLRKLYSHYISTQNYIRTAGRSVNGTNVRGNATHQFTNVASGFTGLFWSLFGLTDLQLFSTEGDNFLITKETGQILFGLFQVLGVIIAINMLIAMMTRSFDDIAQNAITKWKVSRTRLWMLWVEKGSILPPPLNLIPNIRYIYKQIKKLCNKCCSKDEEGQTNMAFADITDEGNDVRYELTAEKRHRKIKDILKRYIGMRKIRDNYESDAQTSKSCSGCCSREKGNDQEITEKHSKHEATTKERKNEATEERKNEATEREEEREKTEKLSKHDITEKDTIEEDARQDEDVRETSEITLSL